MPKLSISVLKFGGSVVSGPQFRDWLRVLTKWSESHAVCVVPGGGILADAVRTLQTQTGLDDITAHELALMTMRQIGMTMQTCSREYFAWAALDELKAKTDIRQPLLWVPDDQEFEFSGLPRDWSVSSDSIALWLAEYLNAKELILLKSVAPPTPSVADWSRADYVDNYFVPLLRKASVKIRTVSSFEEL